MTSTLIAGNPEIRFEEKTASKTILMFAFHFPPSLQTGARRPYRFAKYLNAYGYRVHVVTAVPPKTERGWPSVSFASEIGASKKARFRSRTAACIQRFLPYNDQLPWIGYALEAAEKFLVANPVSAVISTSPPFVSHLAACAIKRQYGLPWIADYRDPLLGNPSRKRKWGWIWDAPMDCVVANQADAIIANTDAAAEMFRKRYPQREHKIHLIWNGYDPEHVFEAKPIPVRDYRIMLHAGSLYGQRHPSALLGCLRRLFRSGALRADRLRLRFVGEIIPGDPWILSSGFPDCVSEGWVEHTSRAIPAAEAQREMAEADLLLLLDLNDRGVGLQVPAKLFEYIQIGRPILAFTSRNSPTERILTQSGVPHVCIYGDAPATWIDQEVLRLLRMPSDPISPSQWFRNTFDGRAQTAALAAILDRICDERQRSV
jgi:glycosyltransferase involved in cell wall biosynthesis